MAALQQFKAPLMQCWQQTAAGEHAAMPVEQRPLQLFLHLHIHHPVVISRSGDWWQHQQRIGSRREATVAVGRPGHRRAVRITITQSRPVAHPQFIAVVQAGHARQAVDQTVQQAIGSWVAVEKRCETSIDAPVQPVPLPLRQANPDGLDHLLRNQVTIAQPELVVVAQRQGPAHPRNGLLRLNQASLQLTGATSGHCSEQMRCQHEIKGTMQLVIRQIGGGLLHRLDRLPQQQHITLVGFHSLTQTLEKRMGLRQPLTACAFGFKQERHRV